MRTITRFLRRFLILLIVFVIGVAGTAFLMNNETTDDRSDMNNPTLPEVMVDFNGTLANRMYGYRQPMEADFVRDSVTPLDTTKKLTIAVNPYEEKIKSLSYEVRTSDGTKIVENRSVKDKDAKETAEIVGLSAIKYGDLSNQASKDYIFDVDRFTSFEGNTGPYILYTIVRIKSILKKYAENGGVLDGMIRPAENDAEKSLMLQVVKFNEVIDNVYKETAPHKLCAYIYDLANDFNKFYHETKILAEEDEEKKKGYLALLTLAKKVLETCIDLLGFTAPERM